jgi:hypothetical protein
LDVKWERTREKKVDGWIEEERRKRRGFSDRGRLTCVLRNKIIEQSSKRPEGLWEGENRSNFFGGGGAGPKLQRVRYGIEAELGNNQIWRGTRLRDTEYDTA